MAVVTLTHPRTYAALGRIFLKGQPAEVPDDQVAQLRDNGHFEVNRVGEPGPIEPKAKVVIRKGKKVQSGTAAPAAPETPVPETPVPEEPAEPKMADPIASAEKPGDTEGAVAV